MNKSVLPVVPVLTLVFVLAAGVYASPMGTWTKYLGNPVLTPGPSGSWDDEDVFCVEVVHDGTLYRLWYTGQSQATQKSQIGYATSVNGTIWAKHSNNPVLQVGSEGSWDSQSTSAVAVILDGSVWKMWYTGNGNGGTGIGYATSPDGVNWTKYDGNPVLSPGPPGNWDDGGVFAPYVMLKQGTYHMWYSGVSDSNIRIGYATSADGIVWIKHSSNPVLDKGSSGTWDSLSVVSPSVVFMNGEYHMWYQGRTSSSSTIRESFGHATSSDGISWTKDPSNPVLTPGPSGSWDAYNIHYPSVVYQGGLLRMWYHGFDVSDMSGGTAKIGYAEAYVTEYKVFLPIVVK